MGKRDKEHRAKVAKRNKKIQQAQKVYQRMYSEMMMKEFEREKIYKMYLDVFGKNGISKIIIIRARFWFDV